jgi:tetratricopeptide (TPR) repeat protein
MNWISEIFKKLNFKQFIILVFIVGFAIYGNTLNHDYALDDAIVITKNEFTKQGFKGIPDILSYDSFTGFFGKEKQLVDGGRYRPLSIVTLAIEYQLFGESPQISHFINLVAYCLIVILAYLVIIQLLSIKYGDERAKLVAFFTAIVFLLHPIHTEVVANIKGRDELLSLLFSLLAFRTVLNYIDFKNLFQLVLSSLYLFLALMSKENAVAFVFIIPLSIIYFRNVKPKFTLIGIIPLVLAASVFLTIRHSILGGFQQNVATELMNNPFLHATDGQKYATLFYTWAIYFKLLLFPHPLTYDYYPYHIPLVEFSNPIVIFSILIITFLAIVAILGLKKKSLISFALLGFAATFSMVSNLFFPIGTFMNERFVFMPSLFWSLGLSSLAVYFFQNEKSWVKAFILICSLYVLVFFPLKTIARNRVWKNDLKLFIADVKTSSQSAKSNCSAGGKLWEEGKVTVDNKKKAELFALSEKYLRKSLQIHPTFVDAWLLLGNVLFDGKKDVEESSNCFLKVLKREPGNPNAHQNIDIVLQNSEDRSLQLNQYTRLHAIDSNTYTVNYRLGVLYGRYFGELQKGIYYLNRATQLDPSKVEALKDLGTAYGIMGREKEAYEICKRALSLDKSDAQIYINLGIASSKLGYQEESKLYFKEAERINSSK